MYGLAHLLIYNRIVMFIVTKKLHLRCAILQRGFDQTNLVGSIGGVTYRRVGGVTVASQKVPMHVAHTRTARLMLTRMKWVNLVALWRAINQTGWHPSFQRENRRVSDFNMFLRTNFESAATFIKKGISRSGGSVVAPVRLTSGSTLAPVAVGFGSNGVPLSDLVCPITIGQSTTLKGFSEAIVNNNNDWLIGDKLTILVLLQSAVNNVPVAIPNALSVTLDDSDAASTTLLGDLLDVSLLGVVDDCLTLAGAIDGGFSMVHSRLVDGETICSTADLVVQNSILASYQGLTAFNEAAESYGGIARNYLLTPDVNVDILPNV